MISSRPMRSVLAMISAGLLVLAPSVRAQEEGGDAAAPAAASSEEGTRKHASGAFAVGAVGPDGFGAGFAGNFGWDLSELFGIEFSFGVGGMQGRGGGAVGGVYAHGEVLLPITFNVCASIPRVCPALDLEISVLPGLGYGYLDGLNAGNVVLGFAVSSLRKTQDMDVGVRAAVLSYLDVVGSAMEQDASRVLSMVTLQLGFIIRWGFTQP